MPRRGAAKSAEEEHDVTLDRRSASRLNGNSSDSAARAVRPARSTPSVPPTDLADRRSARGIGSSHAAPRRSAGEWSPVVPLCRRRRGLPDDLHVLLRHLPTPAPRRGVRRQQGPRRCRCTTCGTRALRLPSRQHPRKLHQVGSRTPQTSPAQYPAGVWRDASQKATCSTRKAEVGRMRAAEAAERGSVVRRPGDPQGAVVHAERDGPSSSSSSSPPDQLAPPAVQRAHVGLVEAQPRHGGDDRAAGRRARRAARRRARPRGAGARRAPRPSAISGASPGARGAARCPRRGSAAARAPRRRHRRAPRRGGAGAAS